MSTARSWIGRSVPRHEDARLLTGRGTFVDDLQIPNVHHAAILRSPHAHARIACVDLSKALALDGVVGGLTGREVAERTRPFSVVATSPMHYFCMAIDKARFVGEPGALHEQLVYDDDGQCLTATLVDYECPFSTEAPKIDIGHLESPSPFTPLGSKGAGESSSETAPACIANAVADALASLGVEVTELPLAPHRCWQLVQAARATKEAESA